MSRAYRTRRKAIRDERHRLNVKKLVPKEFHNLQAKWRSAIDGPPIGTLQDILAMRVALTAGQE